MTSVTLTELSYTHSYAIILLKTITRTNNSHESRQFTGDDGAGCNGFASKLACKTMLPQS